MAKSRCNLLFVFAVVCLSVIVIISALTVVTKSKIDEKAVNINASDFPIETDLLTNVFNVGETVSFNTSITNKCGRDVNVTSNGFMPCTFFYEINDTTGFHVETTMIRSQILKANDKLSQVANHIIVEPPGTYVFEVHYNLNVDGIDISNTLKFIVEVK